MFRVSHKKSQVTCICTLQETKSIITLSPRETDHLQHSKETVLKCHSLSSYMLHLVNYTETTRVDYEN